MNNLKIIIFCVFKYCLVQYLKQTEGHIKVLLVSDPCLIHPPSVLQTMQPLGFISQHDPTLFCPSSHVSTYGHQVFWVSHRDCPATVLQFFFWPTFTQSVLEYSLGILSSLILCRLTVHLILDIFISPNIPGSPQSCCSSLFLFFPPYSILRKWFIYFPWDFHSHVFLSCCHSPRFRHKGENWS